MNKRLRIIQSAKKVGNNITLDDSIEGKYQVELFTMVNSLYNVTDQNNQIPFYGGGRSV